MAEDEQLYLTMWLAYPLPSDRDEEWDASELREWADDPPVPYAFASGADARRFVQGLAEFRGLRAPLTWTGGPHVFRTVIEAPASLDVLEDPPWEPWLVAQARRAL